MRVTNISGGLIVCDFKGGTLRLKDGESVQMRDSDVTHHLEVLSRKGLVRFSKEDAPKAAQEKAQERAQKGKGADADGNV